MIGKIPGRKRSILYREVAYQVGIIWKKYSNIPYERIQNIDIRRGILARLFGFSELLIQTAGYSGGGLRYRRRRSIFSAPAHVEGYIPAVPINSAEEIRDFILNKVAKKK